MRLLIIIVAFMLGGCAMELTGTSGGYGGGGGGGYGGTYTITFNTNGGDYISPISGSYGNEIRLPRPYKSGKTFYGWVSSLYGGHSYGTDGTYYKITSNITMYACWEWECYSGANDCQTPYAPSVSATQLDENAVQVSWNWVSNAEHYEVYRSTSSNGSYQFITRTDGTSVSDNISQSGTYYYKIKAINSCGYESSFSNYAWVTLTPKIKTGTLVIRNTDNLFYLTSVYVEGKNYGGISPMHQISLDKDVGTYTVKVTDNYTGNNPSGDSYSTTARISAGQTTTIDYNGFGLY